MDQSNAAQSDFNTSIVSSFSERITRVGVIEGKSIEKQEVGVSTTHIVRLISEDIAAVIRTRSFNDVLSADDIENYLNTLVKARVLQLHRKLPKHFNAQDVPVPDFFLPVLAGICKYSGTFDALDINPTLRIDDTTVRVKDLTEGMVTKWLVPAKVYDVGRLLKAYGMSITAGLPRSLTTSSDAIFRINENEHGELLVAGDDVDERSLLIRTVIRIEFLRQVYGAPRTRYLSVEDSRTAWDSLVGLGFSTTVQR